jgi:hypothetical protein
LLSTLACLMLAGWVGLYRIRTFDTLFHLAAGRLILRQGHVPTTDPFSFSFRGAPWLNHSWGFELLLAALHRVGGFALLSMHQALAAVILAAVGLASLRRERELLPIAAPLMAAPLIAFREVVEARPHVIGFIALALTLCVTLHSMSTRRPQRLVWLAPVYAGWAISHGSHLLAFVVVGAAVPGLLLRDRRRLAPWLLCLCTLLALCLWLAPSALLQGREHLASGFLEGSVSEWYPVALGELLQHGSGLTFLAVLALAWSGAGLAHLRPDEQALRLARGLYPLLLLAGFSVLAFSSRRMIALLLLGAAPLWLPYASHASRRALHALPRAPCWLERLALASCFCALSAVLVLDGAAFQTGCGLAEHRFPSAAVASMRARARITRVYNAYNFGGFLMFEGFPPAGVFIDGRALTIYPPEFLATFERAYRNTSVFEALVQRFAIDGALLPTDSERSAPLRAYLDRSPRWHPTFRDRVAVVYERAPDPR